MTRMLAPTIVLSAFGALLLSYSRVNAFAPPVVQQRSAAIPSGMRELVTVSTPTTRHDHTWKATNRRDKRTSLSFALLTSLVADQGLIADVVRDSSYVLQQYGELLRQFPLTTKSITAAILAFCGDAIAQFATKDEDQEKDWYDLTRGLTFLGFGAVYTGAYQHVWFEFLSSHIVDWGDQLHLWGPLRVAEEVPLDTLLDTPAWWSYFDIVSTLENPPTPAMLAAAKVSVNQFLMVPSVYMPLFFFVTSQFDFEKAKERAQALYLPLLTRNYFFWLPTQFVQFFLLPTEWQIPFLSVASLVWTVILSAVGSGSQQQEQQPEELKPALATAETTLTAEDAALVLEEEVTLKDVRQALVTKPVDRILQDDRVGASAAGLALGVLAAAADDAALAEAVSDVFKTKVGSGVAIVSALGAGAGLAIAASKKKKDDDDEEGKLEDSILNSNESDQSSPTSKIESMLKAHHEHHLLDVPLSSQ